MTFLTLIWPAVGVLIIAAITHTITTDLRTDGLRAHEERGQR